LVIIKLCNIALPGPYTTSLTISHMNTQFDDVTHVITTRKLTPLFEPKRWNPT